MKKWICLLLCLQFISITPAVAQQEDDLIKSTQNDLLLVAGAGAGGAILGLSTLSFYETPSKHVSNIWTGAAIGVIVGVIYVAYSSAQRGSMDLIGSQTSPDFNTSDRALWHSKNNDLLSFQSVQFGTQIWQKSF